MNAGFKSLPKKLYSNPVKISNLQKSGFFGMSNLKETFYSIKDGNWSDVSVWETVSGRKGKLPTSSDDVYVRHVVSLDISAGVNNLFVKGTFTAAGGNTIIIFGDIQSKGLIDFTGSSPSIYLRGSKSFISDFLAGNSSFSYCAFQGYQPILPLTYYNLLIFYDGSPGTFINNIKQLTGDIVCLGNLNLNANGRFIIEASIYNITVNGITQLSSYARFSKRGSGSLLFIDNAKFALGINSGYDFSGNPDVEFRGGILTTGNNPAITGTGKWRFTTNDQQMQGAFPNMLAPIIVVGPITVTNLANTFLLNSSIDGTEAASTLVNSGTIYFNTLASTSIMATAGVFDYTSFANTIGYTFNGDFVLPYTTYYILYISATGTKSFSAQPTINGTLNVGGSGILDLTGYSLYVPGTTVISSASLKNIGGSAVFVGQVQFASGTVDFSLYDPTIEFRGGLLFWPETWIMGTQPLKFTTNNQDFYNGHGGGSYSWSLSVGILVSGAITVTYGTTTSSIPTMVISGTINGDNVNSTFVNKTAIEYKNSVRPMVTGILQCDAAANTFKYNMLGDQDVTGGTYRTLEFGGSGIKTLQGNVVVNTTAGGSWSITGSATINYNGYTITTI